MSSPEKDIAEKAEAVAEEIREYSRKQKEFWIQVPYLALQADGRSGYSDQYARAYRSGYWALQSSVGHGVYDLMVDLESGEIVSSGQLAFPAKSQRILYLSFSLEELNAKKIVDDLRLAAKDPHASYYKPAEQEKWRKELCGLFGLLPKQFKRKETPWEVQRRWADTALREMVGG